MALSESAVLAREASRAEDGRFTPQRHSGPEVSIGRWSAVTNATARHSAARAELQQAALALLAREVRSAGADAARLAQSEDGSIEVAQLRHAAVWSDYDGDGGAGIAAAYLTGLPDVDADGVWRPDGVRSGTIDQLFACADAENMAAAQLTARTMSLLSELTGGGAVVLHRDGHRVTVSQACDARGQAVSLLELDDFVSVLDPDALAMREGQDKTIQFAPHHVLPKATTAVETATFWRRLLRSVR